MKAPLSLIFLAIASLHNSALADPLNKGVNDVRIASGDGLAGYQDIISGKRPAEIDISAKLYLPGTCADQKYPAVIIQHGSGKPNRPFYKDTAQALNGKGIVALVPDSFSARGISSTGKDQSQLSKATRVYDTFAAFRYLQSLGCVDAKRVGITGYSFGGIVSIDSVEKALAEKLGNGYVYKASLPVYPSCQTIFETTKPTNTKVHILVGERDDYTPASYCLDAVKAKKTKGWDIDITIFENAHHGFNYRSKPKKFALWTFGGCGEVYIDDDGYEGSKRYKTSTRDGWKKYARTMAESCGKIGVTVGGSKELAQRTIDFTADFFSSKL